MVIMYMEKRNIGEELWVCGRQILCFLRRIYNIKYKKEKGNKIMMKIKMRIYRGENDHQSNTFWKNENEKQR